MTVKKLLLLALLGSSLPAQGEMRIFTDTKGRTMKAEIVSVSVGTVTVRLENGTAAEVPLSSLSKADQDFVNTWRIYTVPALAPAVPPVDFKVTWTKDRQGGKVRPVKDRKLVVERISEQWMCHFKITNPTRTPYDDVRMEYQIFVRQGKGGLRPGPSGSANIPSIGALQTATVDSAVMTLSGTSTRTSTTFTSTDGTKTTVRNPEVIDMDAIYEVSLVFKKDGVEIDRYESPGLK